MLPGIDQSGVTVIADPHATQALDPTERAFDGPAVLPGASLLVPPPELLGSLGGVPVPGGGGVMVPNSGGNVMLKLLVQLSESLVPHEVLFVNPPLVV